MAGFFCSGITSLNRVAFAAGENCYAVVGLLAKADASVTVLFQDVDRKLVVRALRLLKADDVGLRSVKPPGKVRQSRKHRVHIPASDFHTDAMSDVIKAPRREMSSVLICS